jgi:4-diphosphocytidyl-2-C-methyl-D-erythritol kinase
MIAEQAPAKINLTLEVLGKRPDGFHEIRSILQTIDLCDFLYFDKGEGTSITCDLPDWSSERSLVTQAIDLLRETSGSRTGVSLRVEKRIPLRAGLGGDSSDAAAVLRGLNGLWGLGLDAEQMAVLAARIGSDVAFFLRGGTALAGGRGEQVKPLPSPPEKWVVLVVPDIERLEGKTGRMYAALRPAHFTGGGITEDLAADLRGGGDFGEEMMFNTFENIAFDEFDVRRVYVEHLLKMGAPRVHLAGSGPALFAMYRDKAAAGDLYRSCKNQRMEAYLASTPYRLGKGI